MTSDSLRSFAAVPLATVFLIVLLCIFTQKRPPATGLSVPVTHVRTFPFNDCYDDRSVWILLFKDGGIRINETPVPRNELRLRISRIYADRQEPKAAFMRVDPEVPFGDFLDVYERVVSASHGLRVGVITDGLESGLKACPKGASCGLDWPDHDYIPWCLYFNSPALPVLRSPLSQK
jgi:biopolymer transport protein ExbD